MTPKTFILRATATINPFGTVVEDGTAFEVERGLFLSAQHVIEGPWYVGGQPRIPTSPTWSIVGIGTAPIKTDLDQFAAPTSGLPISADMMALSGAASSTPFTELIGLAAFVDITADQVRRYAQSVFAQGYVGGVLQPLKTGMIVDVNPPDIYSSQAPAVKELTGAGLISTNFLVTGGESGGPQWFDFGQNGDSFALGSLVASAPAGPGIVNGQQVQLPDASYSSYFGYSTLRQIFDTLATPGTFQDNEQKGRNLIVGSDNVGAPDDIKGTYRRDVIFAEDGNDKVQATEGSDELNGGKGVDTLSYRDIYAYGTADRIAIKDIKLKNATNIEGITKGTFFLDKTYQGSSPIGIDQYRSFENLVTQTKEWRKAAGLDAPLTIERNLADLGDNDGQVARLYLEDNKVEVAVRDGSAGGQQVGYVDFMLDTAVAGPGDDGRRYQVVTIDEGTNRNVSLMNGLFIDGKQLVGGAAFDFDKHDRSSSGLVKAPFPSKGGPYPVVWTVDQVQNLTNQFVGTALDFFKGISGNVGGGPAQVGLGPIFGFALAPIIYGGLVTWVQSWHDIYSQRIIGTQGELYELLNKRGTGDAAVYDLYITIHPSDAPDYKIEIKNWRQGDFGLRIETLEWRNGLDSGTNKNGKFDSWQNLDLAFVQSQLAGLGFKPNELPPEPDAGNAGNTPPPPVQRNGNEQDNILASSAGADTLFGAGGNDTLRGGEGRDTYLFGANDGADVIEDLSIEGNIIRFLDGLDVASITRATVAGQNGAQDLLITYAGGSIRIIGWSTLTSLQQAAWSFDSVAADLSSNNPADEPDLSVIPESAGGTAKTRVDGTIGDDRLVTTGINEEVYGLDGNDTVEAGGGNDGVFGGAGNDTLRGESGDDVMTGDAGADVLEGGDGKDQIEGGDGADRLTGGKGNDHLLGGKNDDIYYFGRGDGADIIEDTNDGFFLLTPDNTDTLRLTGDLRPSDIIIEHVPTAIGFNPPSTNEDIVLRIAGTSDSVYIEGQYGAGLFSTGFNGIDRVEFDTGEVWTREDIERIYLQRAVTVGADQVFTFYGDDRIVGGAGNDTLRGNYGSDTYVWGRGDGNDLVIEEDSDTNIDRIELGAGIAVADVSIAFPTGTQDLVITVAGTSGGQITVQGQFGFKGRGIERLVFADGTVWTATDINARVVAASITTGNDTVRGSSETDVLASGSGNDTILAGGGDDRLEGGAGNDTLRGDAVENGSYTGNDTYVFATGWGQDVVADSGSNSGGADSIVFSNQNIADLAFARAGTSLSDFAISRIGSTDTITLQSFIGVGRIERFTFADGTALTDAEVYAIADARTAATNAVNGTSSAQTLTGTTGNDLVSALAGNDTVNAGDGNDYVDGGTGNDILNGAAGNDLLLGGAGIDTVSGGDANDSLYGGGDNDTLRGDAGNDSLRGESGNDRLEGGAGDDTLIGDTGTDTLLGGTGVDVLRGGAGSDTYIYNRGDGPDVIDAGLGRTIAETEVLTFGAGITAAELRYAIQASGDLVVTFANGAGDSVTIRSFLSHGALTRFTFADASQLTYSQILETAAGATAGNDTRTAIDLGVYFTDQSVAYGGRGNDALSGLIFSDTTFVFSNGDGVDTISSMSPGDTLSFVGTIQPSDLRFQRSGVNNGDLAITFATGTDRVNVQGIFANGTSFGDRVIRFTDGTVWSWQTLLDNVMAGLATSGNDTIVGGNANEKLTGGAGADTLQGGAGDDTYSFLVGHGSDIVDDQTGSADVLDLGTGINPLAVSIARSVSNANDLVITISATDVVTLKGQLSGGGVELVRFASGTVWTRDDLFNKVLAAAATTGNDTITGSVGSDTLRGGVGSDTLVGGQGADTYLYATGDGSDVISDIGTDSGRDVLQISGATAPQTVSVRRGTEANDLVLDLGGGTTITLDEQLAGKGIETVRFSDGTEWTRIDLEQKLLAVASTTGADAITGSAAADTIGGGLGNDNLNGSGGADRYLFALGDGTDVIRDTGNEIGTDTLALGAGIDRAKVDLARTGNDLILSVHGASDQVRIVDHFVAGGARIGTISFSDGLQWELDEIDARALDAAPVVAGTIGAQSATQNAPINLVVPAGIFTDAGQMTFRAKLANGDPLPAWLAFNGTAFTGTPPNSSVGTTRIQLEAQDNAGNVASVQFDLTVQNVNDAPVPTLVLPNRTAAVGAVLSYQLPSDVFVDPDNGLPGVPSQTITLTATRGDGSALPSWLTFNPATRTFTGTPAAANQGPLDVLVRASDGITTTTTRFGIQVGATNTAPQLGTAIAEVVATEDAELQFTIPANAFTDANTGDRLRYGATLADGTPLPSWIVLDPVTGTFTGLPTNAAVGTFSVRVTATDISGASANRTFALRVVNTNDAPTATAALESYFIAEDSPFSYQIPAGLFSDGDAGDTLTLSASLADGSQLPAWLAFNPITRIFSGAPDNGDTGTIEVRVTARDPSSAATAQSFYLFISGTNDAPVVRTPLPQQSAGREFPFAFTIAANTFVDIDSPGVSLSATLENGDPLPSWLTFNPLTRQFSGIPDANSVGDTEGRRIYRIAVTATDDLGASVTTVFNLSVLGPNSGNIILGTSGDDVLDGTAGPDIIDGGAGNDTLQGREGTDIYVFGHGSGHDLITGRFDNGTILEQDIVEFSADVSAGQVVVERVASFPDSPDSIYYDYYDPTIIRGVYLDDLRLRLTDTNETLTVRYQLGEGEFAVSEFRFTDGTVWSAESLVERLIVPTLGDDLLIGAGTDDVLSGGAGNDRILGAGGNDTLDGGAGNDDLYGGSGQNIIHFGRGGGQDRLINGGSTGALRFGPGIAVADLVLTRDARDPSAYGAPPDAGSLLIQIRGTTDQIRIYRQYAISGEGTSSGVNRFEFADGTVLTRQQIDELLNPGNIITGTAGNDSLFGTSLDERLIGLSGNDMLDGNDGDDTYVWNLGDGFDVISEYDILSHDVLEFGAGILPSDVMLVREYNFDDYPVDTREPNDLLLVIGANQEKLIIDWAYLFDVTTGAPKHTIDEVRFQNGTVWDVQYLIDYFLASTTSADTILGYEWRADRIDGGAGNDVLRGLLGGDTYVFDRGYGNDRIGFDENFFRDDTEFLEFGPGIRFSDVSIERAEKLVNGRYSYDWVFSVAGATDTLTLETNEFDYEITAFRSARFLGDGLFKTWADLQSHYVTTHQTVGNDQFTGFAGLAVIDTGLGNDTINANGAARARGGIGNDTYTAQPGLAPVIIDDGGSTADLDTLEFKAGVLPSEVVITRAANLNDLIVTSSLHFDSSIRIVNALVSTSQAIEQFRFADGTIWNAAEIATRTLPSLAELNPIIGTAGNDTLVGQGGLPELLDGKAGNDRMTGGDGDDTYLYTAGYGNDVIVEPFGYQDTDTVRLNGLLPAAVTLLRRGPDLVVQLGSGETLTVEGHFVDGVSTVDDGIEELVFADGTVWGRADIATRAWIQGTAATDDLSDTSGSDTLAGAGADDILRISAGSDTVRYAAGDGNDIVYDQSSSTTDIDRLVLLGINPGNVEGTHNGTRLDIRVVSTGHVITVADQFFSTSSNFGFEEILFADGTVWNRAAIASNAWFRGTDGVDTLPTSALDDTYFGRLGDDTINTGAGSDTFVYRRGDGADFINESTGSVVDIDTLRLTDLNAADVSLEHVGNDLVFVTLFNGQRVEIDEHFFSLTQNWGIERIVFANGETWDLARINSETYYRGTALADNLVGSVFADNLDGGAGDDTLNGGAGADRTLGGLGNDTHIVDNAGDVVVELAGQGTDLVQSSLTYILGGDVENLTLTGSLAINGTGNILANVLTGNSGANVLDGGAGADTMIGGGGNDTYYVDLATDVVTEAANAGTDLVFSQVNLTLAANVDNLTLLGTATTGTGNTLNNVITGNALANTLTGDAGNDTLDGGAGADTMIGGAGNDIFFVDNAGDIVTEIASGGTDLVQSSISYTLGTEVDNLTLLGSAALSGTGNALNNTLTGNDGNNILSGGAGTDMLDGGLGADSLVGGAGNDTYFVDHVGDTITEALNEGTDNVQSAVTILLGANVENLTLTGTGNIDGTGNALANSLTGNSGNNILTGGDGNDALNGGAGADTLIGGLGNDSYTIDNVGDVITESAGAGTDFVTSSVTFVLGADVENLTLLGSATINGTGNALANALTGGSGVNILDGGDGNDTLNGGAGVDTLIGGLGNDAYTVDNAGDVVIESADAGIDSVTSSVTFVLGANVENLTLSGSAAINGTGNALANVLTGGSGANVLDGGDGNDTLNGGSGADTLIGGLGDDIFVIDNIGDVLTELAGQGIDTVQSGIAHVLGAEFENLTLTGTAALAGTGNVQANTLVGNTGANTLDGGAGNDTLDGGSGADRLIGGAGNDILVGGAAADRFVFSAGFGNDVINVFADTTAESDIIEFSSAVFASFAAVQVASQQVGADVVISASPTDKVTVKNTTLANLGADDFAFL